MKNSLLLLLFVLLFSCETAIIDEGMVVLSSKERDAIKAELASLKSPEKQEFINIVASSKQKLKAGSASLSLIEVFPLAEESFEIYEGADGTIYAAKKFYYSELSNQANRLEVLTMFQQFQIIGGKLDTSGYSIEYRTGCEDSRFFEILIPQGVDILELTCVFYFNNGSQYAYRIFNGDLRRVKLPNLGEGRWKIMATTYDGDLTRRQTTGLIDYSYEGNQLYLVPQPKETNVVAKLSIPKKNLEGVYSIKVWAEDPETGEQIWMDIPFVFNRESDVNVSFNLPFHPQRVSLISDSSPWKEYGGDDMIVVLQDGELPTYVIIGLFDHLYNYTKDLAVSARSFCGKKKIKTSSSLFIEVFRPPNLLN